jgi:hypothetical protein
MTEPITLEFTFEELQMIYKYIEYHDYDCDKPLLEKIRNAYPKPDVIEIGGVKYQRVEEPPKPMDEVMDEVINRMVEERNSKKLWNIMRDKLGFSIDMCDEIVDAVEEWIPEPQSTSGSQNTFVEIIVEGYNDCLKEMKEILR